MSCDRKGRRAADFAQEVDLSVRTQMAELFALDRSFNSKRNARVKGRHTRRRRSMVYVSSEVRELLDAVTDGDHDKVRALLKGGHAVNLEDEQGNTALIFAAESEPLILETLLQHGAAVDHQNKNGMSALMVAVKHEEIESIKALVQLDADVNAVDTQGRNAIDYAKETCNENVLRVLLGMSEGNAKREKTEPALPVEVMRRGSLPSCTGVGRRIRAFLDAVSEGDFERINRLMGFGVDVNCADDVGNSALHFAAEGEPDTIELLVSHGANLDLKNQWGRTPLMAAIAYCDPPSVEALLNAGADATGRDQAGHDITWYAKESKSSVIQALVREAMRS